MKKRTRRPAAQPVVPADLADSTPRSRALSRRRFVALVAGGSVALLGAPAERLAAAPPRRVRPGPPPPAALRAEIEKQKKSVGDALATIRAYPLPPGSDMAFVFRPLRRRRRK